MPAKKLTAAAVKDLVYAAAEAADATLAIRAATSGMQMEHVPDVIHLARQLTIAARDLNQTALSLFTLHALQEQRAKMDAMK